MTERLYYTDAGLTEFESQVVACAPVDGRFEVSLAATAFHPTGGGQPNDLGSLGGHAVLDVIDRDEGGIVHVVDGPLEMGAQVRGVVDWRRRLDHMQQHSGQHMLSAAFQSVGQAQTTSFHLGVASSTIDLNRVVSPAQIAAAEDEVNRIVWQDREVRLRFVSAGEVAALPLRKETGREGTLRLIEIEGFDLSACGGTHVARTGVVGIIAVTGGEKFKGGTRVEFVCGGRALARIREWRDVFASTSRVLSVAPMDLSPAIERLQDENKALGKATRGLQEQLAVHVAGELVAARSRVDERVVVVQAMEGWDATGLKAIATAVAATGAAAGPSGACVAVFSATSPALVVVACSPAARVDASFVLKTLLARFGGKGGGTPDFAQGGGLQGDMAEILAAARELLAG